MYPIFVARLVYGLRVRIQSCRVTLNLLSGDSFKYRIERPGLNLPR